MNEYKNGATRTDVWIALLVEWYKKHARPLPWREDQDPYHVWISEIMLQQTRIEAVVGYYARFMETFPTAFALAEAEERDVLKAWEGLGYYSRARNLHKAAKIIAEQGEFPQTWEEIRALPGIGEYTAGAIAAIAFGLPETAVDGNVMRVVSRLELLEENVLLDSARKHVGNLLKEHYPKEESAAFVQGLMELGEVICLPGKPLCTECPLNKQCLAHENNKEEELPVRIKKTTRRFEEMAVVLLKDEEGRYLFYQRPDTGVLGGLWELPNCLMGDKGGSQREVAVSIERGLKEKYGLVIRPESLQKVKEEKHVFTHITWNMTIYQAQLKETKELADAGDRSERTCCYEDKDIIMLPTAFRKIFN